MDFETLALGLQVISEARLTLIDMPLGLLSGYRKGGRPCDQLARKMLPRQNKSSVFSAPPRSILSCKSFEEAQKVMVAEGGGITLQTFHIIRKIRELDEFVQDNSSLKIEEAHPEILFNRLKGEALASKKKREGREERVSLLKEAIGEMEWPPPKGLPKEDCLDAAVLSWRAFKSTSLQLRTLGCEAEPLDPVGIPMRIVY